MAARVTYNFSKCITFVALIAVLLLSQTSQAFAASATLTMTSSTVSTTVGQTFSVKIDLDTGGATTDGTRAIILYDKNLLEAIKIAPGSLYKEYPTTAQNIDNTTGTVKVSGIAPDAPFSGTGTFATIDFTAKASGTASIKFDFTQGSTTDSNVADTATSSDILNAATGTTISISGGTISSPFPGTPTPKPINLPNTASINPTIILGSMGSLFVIVGLGTFVLSKKAR